MIGWKMGRYLFKRYVKIKIYFMIGIFEMEMMIEFKENEKRIENMKDYKVWEEIGI